MSCQRLLICLCVYAMFGVQCAVAGGGFEIYGYGAQSCGDYLSARKGSDSSPYAAWVNGFLTADSYWISLSAKRKVDFRFDTDLNGTMYWLENFCREHPTRAFVYAVNAFAARQFAKIQAENRAGSSKN